MLTNREEWTLIGSVGVDAGLIHIGDPCYISDGDENESSTEKDEPGLGKNYAKVWSKFCDWFFEHQDKFGNAVMPYQLGHEGRAVIVGGFGGDGSYGVYMRRGKGFFGDITAQILIDFAGDMQDEESDD